MRLRLAGFTCLAFALLASCGDPHAEAPPAAVALTPCAAPADLSAECGSIAVFENRALKRGRQIDVYFMVIRADRPSARQALFLFAGGPGEGSTSMAAAAAGLMAPVRSTMDVVLVDQRGTGRSHPLACPSSIALNPREAFGHVFDPAAVARCRDALAVDADLTQYTTDLAVADVDDVRAALRYQRVAVYGVSYGTRMAQAYMRRFPDRVRSAVLDGVVPFDLAIPLTYAASAQQSIARVFAVCAEQPACRAAHPAPSGDLDTILHRLDAGPVPAIVRAGGTPVTVTMTRGDFGYALRGMLYAGGPAGAIVDRIGRAAASGNLDDFAQAYWSRAVSLERAVAFGQHLSVLCAEDVPFVRDDEIAGATAGTFLGRYLFDEYRAACATWPRGAIAADARTPVAVRVPALLVSGAFDPVTPPEFAERVARSLPLSRAIVAPASGHGSAGGCARAAVQYVLVHGAIDGMPDVCR